MKGTFKIESNIPEQEFMETLLNMKSSGLRVDALLFFHAIANRWKLNKMLYYNNLLDNVEGQLTLSDGSRLFRGKK